MDVRDEILLIDKPVGWTSFDVVAKIRGKIRAEYIARGEKPTKKQLRVGHAGTLDPFATGLLVILLGEACKRAGEFLKLDKTYEFTAKLGEVSTTGDPEGEISPYGGDSSKDQVASSKGTVILAQVIDGEPRRTAGIQSYNSEQPVLHSFSEAESESAPPQKSIINNQKSHTPTIDNIQQALARFTGEITQTPPAYSAIKIDGKRAYKLAREGKSFEIPSRRVTISKLEVVSYEYPYLKCICDVSSGTYIRTLVEDIGKALGIGAYCTQLRRTRIGIYQIENASKIDKIV